MGGWAGERKHARIEGLGGFVCVVYCVKGALPYRPFKDLAMNAAALTRPQVALLLEAVYGRSVVLDPEWLVDLLQAASYLDVSPILLAAGEQRAQRVLLLLLLRMLATSSCVHMLRGKRSRVLPMCAPI